MKLFLTLVALASVALAVPAEDDTVQFNSFVQKFGKRYASSAERAERFAIFKDNLRKVREHNANTKATYKKGINQFSDLTHDEYQQTLGYRNQPRPKAEFSTEKASAALPEYVNWNDLGLLSPVKDQGRCGSCWAFTAVEQMESYAAITNGTSPLPLSTQQLTSCSPAEEPGFGGCLGSMTQMGITYTQLFGIASDQYYPYVSGLSGETGECYYINWETQPSAWTMGFEILPRNNYAAIMEHLATKGPLGLGVNANTFSPYESGIFNDCVNDEEITINHAVQLVGYGTDELTGLDYWLIRNSWSDQWGEGGFIRVERKGLDADCGHDVFGNFVCGTCGVLFEPSYPLGAYYV